MRLHCRPTPPTDADLSREVQEYAVSRLPYMEQAVTSGSRPEQSEEAATHNVAAEKAWSIIEID